jgi:hypothetical protein
VEDDNGSCSEVRVNLATVAPRVLVVLAGRASGWRGYGLGEGVQSASYVFGAMPQRVRKRMD